MPRTKPHTCKVCGGHESEVGYISWRGRCKEHGDGHMLTNARELREHTGESMRRWRRGMARAVGAVLLDERDDAA